MKSNKDAGKWVDSQNPALKIPDIQHPSWRSRMSQQRNSDADLEQRKLLLVWRNQVLRSCWGSRSWAEGFCFTTLVVVCRKLKSFLINFLKYIKPKTGHLIQFLMQFSFSFSQIMPQKSRKRFHPSQSDWVGFGILTGLAAANGYVAINGQKSIKRGIKRQEVWAIIRVISFLLMFKAVLFYSILCLVELSRSWLKLISLLVIVS